MAYFLFARAMLAGEPIKVFNHGDMQRDFTYIDDIVEGILRVLDKTATPMPEATGEDPAVSQAPYRIFNIGNHDPVPLLEFIGAIETTLGVTAEKQLLPMQDGDVPATYADTSLLHDWVGFAPKTPVSEGVARFAKWYRNYYKI